MMKELIQDLKILHIKELYFFKNGRADLVCYDIDKKTNKTDRFTIALISEELNKFLTYEAYN